MRNLLAQVPRGASEMVAATIRTIFAQPTGAMLLEIHDEWAVDTRRYLSLGSLAELDRPDDDGMTKEVEGARGLLLAS